MKFSYNHSYQSTIGMAPCEMLYEWKCRSLLHWDEVSERKILGLEAVREASEAVEKIRIRMLTAQSRQKRFADPKRRDIEFAVGGHVLLRLSPMKGVMRFGKMGKLSPRFIGPFEILERVWPMAYYLALPPALSKTHNIFYISMLRKYMSDPSNVLSYKPLELRKNLSYDENQCKSWTRKSRN